MWLICSHSLRLASLLFTPTTLLKKKYHFTVYSFDFSFLKEGIVFCHLKTVVSLLLCRRSRQLCLINFRHQLAWQLSGLKSRQTVKQSFHLYAYHCKSWELGATGFGAVKQLILSIWEANVNIILSSHIAQLSTLSPGVLSQNIYDVTHQLLTIITIFQYHDYILILLIFSSIT